MLTVVLVLTLLAVSNPGQCAAVKKRRDAGAMASDYISDGDSEYLYEYPGDEPGFITAYYEITYEKKFNSKWLDPMSAAFGKEEKRVQRALVGDIAREFNLVESEVSIVVETFFPGSTRAQISVRIPDHYGVTVSDITRKMRSLVNTAQVGRYPITIVSDLTSTLETDPEEAMAIIFELTYEKDNRAQQSTLSNNRSREFEVLAANIASQIELLLVEPLQKITSTTVTPDQMDTAVLSITPVGTLTKAKIQLSVEGVDIESVSRALLPLTESDSSDMRINGGLIIGLDELDRVFLGPTGSGDLLYPGYDYTGIDNDGNEPPDDGFIDGEVMLPKEETTDPPSDPNPVDKPEPTPPSIEELLSPAATEPTPPAIEPTPPPINEPTPPGSCPEILKPNYSKVDCMYGNNIGSICQFTCDSDTIMVGTDTILCGLNGRWNEDPPYCKRLFCQPPVHDIGNGTFECTNVNQYRSTCQFTCDDGFRMIGLSTILCGRNERWTSKQPSCKMIPVNCEDEYGDWSECSGGTRKRAEVVVQRGTTSVVCPLLDEVCIDCTLEWQPWSECGEGVRTRRQHIQQQRVGAGKECDEPAVDRQECVRCEKNWGEWSDCVSDTRSRTQEITVQAVGYECPELQTETQECLPCIVQMGEWSSCDAGTTSRGESVVQAAVNGGRPCPAGLRNETAACQNCEVEWTEWTKCTDGKTSRSMVVTVQPVGVGSPCPELTKEEADCSDCVVDWSDWSACSNGKRQRSEVVVKQQVGEGKICPELRKESEVCVDCEMEWGDWEACIGGLSRRLEYVSVNKEGAGAECTSPKDDYRACANCRMEWQEWSECEDGVRSRVQRVTQQPINVDEPCPEPKREEEPCSDCDYEWSDWSVCDFGISTRTLTIISQPVAAGKACPTETTQSKDCCFLIWGDWSECTDGQRERSEEIFTIPDGESCREPEFEMEECFDCVVDWGNWSECENNMIKRTQFVKEVAKGGKPCPRLKEETDLCGDCVLDWAPWEECADGDRTRQQVIKKEAVGAGKACPDILEIETEECVHCDSEWEEWGECAGGIRVRNLNILQESVGAGDDCPSQRTQTEACVDCVVEWSYWSQCTSNERIRNQIVKVYPVGAGKQCGHLDTEMEECVDCSVGWGEWSGCSNNQRQRSQEILVEPVGAGARCPTLQTEFETCIDCVVEWGPWNSCFGGAQIRHQVISIRQEGAGAPCPTRLPTEERACEGSALHLEQIICRFVDNVLGYKRKPTMRDLLLIADESGSIGWMNFEKIKLNFKAIAKNIRGGIGSQETQIAMTSFALFSRQLFDFDDHTSSEEVIAAIDKTYFKGGYRSRIGDALSDANIWLFQQASGMRSFPHVDDNIQHEILIATDGCRTSDLYHLEQGLKEIKKRGIKLYVLGIGSRDPRCRKTIDAMVEDENDLFMLGSWAELDEMSHRIDEGVCVSNIEGSGTTVEDDSVAKEGESSDEGSGTTPRPSRGDGGSFRGRSRRDVADRFELGNFDQ